MLEMSSYAIPCSGRVKRKNAANRFNLNYGKKGHTRLVLYG
jgi:hypothetical protein